MATEKELKALLAPVLERFPDWRYARSWLFCQPIGYYLRGCAFKRSFYDRLRYELLHCVYPLYEAPLQSHITSGRSCPIPGTGNHGWRVDHPDFARAVIELMETVIVPEVAHIATGSQILAYLERHQFRLGWPEYAKALAHIHMGDLRQARAMLVPLAQMIRTEFPELQQPTSRGDNLLQLLKLLKENPAAIPAHCEDVARRSIAADKLDKHWTPNSVRLWRRCLVAAGCWGWDIASIHCPRPCATRTPQEFFGWTRPQP